MSDVSQTLPETFYTFAGSVDPTARSDVDAVEEGHTWYDPDANEAYVWTGSDWRSQTVVDHGQLSGVRSSDHHSKTTSASDLTDVSPDSTPDAHHSKTTSASDLTDVSPDAVADAHHSRPTETQTVEQSGFFIKDHRDPANLWSDDTSTKHEGGYGFQNAGNSGTETWGLLADVGTTYRIDGLQVYVGGFGIDWGPIHVIFADGSSETVTSSVPSEQWTTLDHSAGWVDRYEAEWSCSNDSGLYLSGMIPRIVETRSHGHNV